MSRGQNSSLEAAPPADVLSVLGNAYSVDILLATASPRTAQELSEELEIPIATCYRRLEELADHGLLVEYDTVGGDDAATYERTVDDLYIDVRDGLSVTTTRPRRVEITLDRRWRRLD